MLLHNLLPVLALLTTGLAAPLGHSKRALPRLGGVNLAGCEFGMTTEGWSGTTYCPGTEQITHFASKGSNVFRFPFGWQYLVGSTSDPSSKSLNAAYVSQFDNLVQKELATGAYVMIDLHNYGRWNGGIVGQGGPTNENLASLWSLLAKKYANQPKIIFGIMNEPHDLDINKWATTVQASVNAIRAAGATTQSIALPGNEWTHPEAWSRGSNDVLLNVKDPADASGSLLIIDVHKYYDGDGSGTSRECSTNGVSAYTDLSNWLKKAGRRAIVSETGGGNTASCQTAVSEALKYITGNTDTFIGFTMWSAGSFDSSYELSLTPNGGTDTELFVKAIQPYLPGASGSVPVSTPKTSAAAPSTPKPTTAVSTSKAASTTSSRAVISTTTAGPTTSTAKPTSLTSASSKAVVTSSTTSKAAPTSKAPATTPPSSRTSTSATVKPTGSIGNLQTYAGALGGFAAPAVTASSGKYTTNGRDFNFLTDALSASCYAQMDKCQNAANSSGNKGDLTVGNCNGQVQDCLKVASATTA